MLVLKTIAATGRSYTKKFLVTRGAGDERLTLSRSEALTPIT